ncbi:hypothetical protein [Pseudobdellovibrio sp. HCB154]|uniref:hypothetical protein n=1 Tax=Pseudobdellovibrio sp. HCB154 TaxID=3386277 RepID=UPI0039174049
MRSQDSANSHLKLSDLPRYEKTENTFQKAFIALQCNCVLCATPLELKVTSEENSLEIKEEAFCPQCNIRMRSKSHTVQ